jgi:HSP20 family protein
MRVTDLIPWRAERRNQPAIRNNGDPVAALQLDVNRAFDDFMRMFPIPLSDWRSLPTETGGAVQVDLQETDKEVKVTAELPGVEDGDIDVRVSNGMLTISAEKKSARDVNEDGYIVRERHFGRVERSLPLPEGIEADAAHAAFKSGVLTVTIPKTTQAQSESKRIPVQAAQNSAA